MKRSKIIKKYSEFPIKFNSLTFRGRSRLNNDIVYFNSNFNSCIDAFINISWLGRGEALAIPIKYSKKHHGNMKKYTNLNKDGKNANDTSYIISFNDKDEVRIILSYEDERFIPEFKSNFAGIDVNIKHNLMISSDGFSIDYDRNLVDVLSKELIKIDELKNSYKKNNDEYVIGKKRELKINSLRRQLKHDTERNIVSLCKHYNSVGIDHAVFENLTNGFGKCYAKNENDLNFNRIVKELNLSSLKDVFEHIARKYDICTSFVHSEYTSQQCSKCGCIDKENRKSQEDFLCIECGFSNNADANASANIKERVVSTVLRNELLIKNKIDNGTFKPKSFNKDKVKKILLSLRNNIYSYKEIKPE